MARPVHARPVAGVLLAALAAPWPCVAAKGGSAAESAAFNGPLRGEYGFLSQFSGITTQEAVQRVRSMWQLFGVLEFELRDAFEDYSRPPPASAAEWGTPLGEGRVQREIIEAMTSEVTRLGGRSWLVVNAMATDPHDEQLQQGARIAGSFEVGDRTLMDVVIPDAQWAEKVASPWAEWAKSLGCSGIHWSSMGDFNGSSTKGADFPAFLRAALPIVRDKGLEQMANFADGFGWDETLTQRRVVAFAYWVVFSVPDQEDEFYRATPRGSVIVLYPGQSPGHADEPWNRFVAGIRPLEVMILRWRRARCSGDTYLAVGDGLRRVTSDYTPMAKEMTEDEVDKVRKAVFGEYTCDDGQVLPSIEFLGKAREDAAEEQDAASGAEPAPGSAGATGDAAAAPTPGPVVSVTDGAASEPALEPEAATGGGGDADAEPASAAEAGSHGADHSSLLPEGVRVLGHVGDDDDGGVGLLAVGAQAKSPWMFWLAVPLLVGASATVAGGLCCAHRLPSARDRVPVPPGSPRSEASLTTPRGAESAAPNPRDDGAMEEGEVWGFQMTPRTQRPRGDLGA